MDFPSLMEKLAFQCFYYDEWKYKIKKQGGPKEGTLKKHSFEIMVSYWVIKCHFSELATKKMAKFYENIEKLEKNVNTD